MRQEDLDTPGAPATDGAGPALALLAWGFALLGTTLLVITEVWLEPRPWVWPAVIAAYLCASVAFLWLARRSTGDGALDVTFDTSLDRTIDAGRGAPFDRATDVGRDTDGAIETGDDRWDRWATEPPPPDGTLYARPGGLLGLRDAAMEGIARRPIRAACVTLSLAVAAGAVIMLSALGDGRPSRDYFGVLGVWIAGVALYAIGLALPDRPFDRLRRWARAIRRDPAPDGRVESDDTRTVALDVLALVAVSLAVRVVMLGSVPNIITGDEGVFGNAAEWMSRGEGSHMFGTYWANATMYLVPHAALIAAIGPTILAIRLPGALAAAFAPAMTYAFGRAAFGRRVGLVAGALVAASHMHVHVSRMGLGHGLDALFSAVALWGLYRGFVHRDVRAATCAGFALGLAQYAYVGARMIDLVAILIVVGLGVAAGVRALAARRSLRAEIARAVPPGPLFAALGAALVTAGPMIRWAVVRTDDYMSRVNTEGLVQSGRAEEMLGEVDGPLGLALSQVRDAVLGFVGAPAVQFYFSTHPMLTVLWASLFVLGLALAVRRVGEARFLMLLAHVLVAGLVLALASNTSTAAYRISGVIPSLAILAAVALFVLVDGAHGREADAKTRRTTTLFVAGLIVAFELWAYFGSFAPACGYWGRPSAIASEVGQHVGAPGRYGAVYTLMRPAAEISAFESVSYLTGRRVEPLASSVLPEGVTDPEAPVPEQTIWDVPEGFAPSALAERIAAAPRPVLVLAATERAAEFEALLAMYPGAESATVLRCGEAVLSWFEVRGGGP